MMLIEFHMRPKPKQRPRHNAEGDTYTPDATKTAEEEIALTTRTYMNAEGESTLQGDVWIDVDFDMKGYRRADLDNLVKLLLDGLQKGGAYTDDKQVTVIKARVRYGCEENLIRCWIGAVE